MKYILNPDKTEDTVLTSSLNCTTNARDAYLQMKAVYDHYARDTFNSPPPLSGKGTVKAIHYIMSFADSENITPELAHKIAKAFVRKNFGDDVQAVIATHVDTSHVHNHVIINSYSLSGQKYYANRTSLRKARETTNGVCRAFGVKPALNFENKGRSVSHYEWEQSRKGTSWKQQIRDEIDKLIGEVSSLDELLQLFEERGYEIKRGKYVSIKAPEQERFVRTKTLGEEYTEDSLKIRITYRDMGTGFTPKQDEQSKLNQAYAAVLNDVRILAVQHKKVPRKRVVTAEYSAQNDLDVYRLSAQLSVINQEHIGSIGELEGRIARLRAEYEKLRWSEQNEKLLQIRRRYDIYCDIVKTYGEISKPDYISGLVEEERQRQEQMKKKKRRR